MKKIRLLPLLMVLCTALSCVALPAHAEETADTTGAIEEAAEGKIQVDNNVEMMVAFGVLDKGLKADINAEITRLDFAKAIVTMFGYNNIGGVGTKFKDIKDAGDLNAAMAACNLKLLDSYDDNTFRPDASVTLPQAAKALVIALGYDNSAKFDGGYVYTAFNIGVFKNISSDLAEKLSVKLFAKMLVNSMNINMMYKSVSGDGTGYEALENRTPLSEILKLTKNQGLVTATRKTHLFRNESTNDGYVSIDNTVYQTNVAADDFIGCSISYYTKEIDDEQVVVYIYDVEKKNDILELAAEDIDGYSNNRYKYYAGKRSAQYAEVSKNKYLIYNGRALTSYTAADMLPKSGGVKLIDNNQDGVYDVVCITEYEAFVVSMIDEEIKKVYDEKSASSVEFDEADSYEIFVDDEKVQFSTIRQNSVLSLAQSKDGKLIAAYVSNKSVRGEVTSLEYENGKIAVVYIDGVEYKTSADYLHAYGDGSKIENKSEGNFYLNHKNEVVLYKASSSQYVTGYLINAAKSGGMDEKLELKVFAETNKIMGFYGKDKVKIDGLRGQNADAVIDILRKGTSEVRPQLIRYKTDEEGLISEIDTVYNGFPSLDAQGKYEDFKLIQPVNGESKESLRMVHSAQYQAGRDPLNDALSTIYYNEAQMSFGETHKFLATSGTKVFVIPNNPKSADEEDFRCVGLSNYFAHDDRKSFDAYSSSENYLTVDTIVVNGVGAADKVDDLTGETAMVDEIIKVIKNDEEAYKIVFADKSEFFAESKHINEVRAKDRRITGTWKIERGDIVYFNYDDNNNITAMEMVLDISEDDPSPGKQYLFNQDNRWGNWADPRHLYADVYDKFGDYYALTTKNIRSLSPQELSDLDADIKANIGNGIHFAEKIGNQGYPNPVVYDRAAKRMWTSKGVSEIFDYKHFGNDYVRVLIVTYNNGFAKKLFVIMN